MIKVVLPQLGEGIEKATVSYWFYPIGQQVNEKAELVELTTDKATFNLPSPCNGTLKNIFFHEGDTVRVGDVLAEMEEK